MENIDVTIERVDPPYAAQKFYVVTVVRLSDGFTVTKNFTWGFLARRFSRSNKQIARAILQEEEFVTNFGRKL